LINKMHN